ncbi:hypothetical protein HBH70_054430 [Parastagonospora nodorum]|nr:hypothetical protein HBH53_144030 [Parastagonospora nodorum]KAH4003565.1 hypothetical protein HBI10_058190 [Parastagonospora nodorum]KAH4029087.1 hypothetical protein HBI13_044170 [Parastagonospora nodorum]KAH4065082.1 hypothetical protein HBH50_171070 [Parastagonospora nodorum]KAH4092375.1 hypothetical protein HBH48_085450 [Parastagonospora nodorum]
MVGEVGGARYILCELPPSPPHQTHLDSQAGHPTLRRLCCSAPLEYRRLSGCVETMFRRLEAVLQNLHIWGMTWHASRTPALAASGQGRRRTRGTRSYSSINIKISP